jgi:hypothetical protein
VKPWSERSLNVLPLAHWSLGILPRPTTGVGALVRYRVAKSWSLALGGDWLPPASERGQFSMTLISGRAGACFDWIARETFGVSSCAHALGGALTVRDEAAHADRAGTEAWFAASLGSDVTTSLGSSWIFSTGLEGAVPFSRPIYRADGCPRVAFQQPAVVARIFAGLGASFF